MARVESELRPLDEEFVERLIAVTGATNLAVFPRRENHFWRDQLRAFRGVYNHAQIAELIAERFNSGEWTDENAPTTSEQIRNVFAGYDRTISTTTTDTAERIREEPEYRQRGETNPPLLPPAASTSTRRETVKTPGARRDPATALPTPNTRGEGRRGDPVCECSTCFSRGNIEK